MNKAPHNGGALRGDRQGLRSGCLTQQKGSFRSAPWRRYFDLLGALYPPTAAA